MTRIRVAVIYGGRSSEHAISCVSAGSILRNLDPERFEVVAIGITPEGSWVLTDAAAVHDLVQRSELLVASTSFGGLHTSVDRRARWGDAVPAGFARISAGIEDTDDLVADVLGALDRG